MKPLIVLLVAFGISIAVLKIMHGNIDYAFAGRIAMAAMLLFTSIGHFKFTKGMTMMIPGPLPYKTAIVYGTGVFEIVAAIGLLIPGCTVLTGWVLIGFFLLLLPANVYAAFRHIDMEKASYHGSGLGYLWFRVPLQVLFVVWVYLSAVLS